MAAANRKKEKDTGNRPLAGLTVLVTRPRTQSGRLVDLLTQLGAHTLEHPVIEILPPTDTAQIDQAIDHLDQFQRIVFVSANGVRFFLEQCNQRGAMKSLSKICLAAIGSQTANRLITAGLHVDLVPEQANSQGLADALIENQSPGPYLLVRADRGDDTLPQRLQQAGIEFQQIAVYRSLDVTHPDPSIIRQLESREIDWVTITSSAIARSTVNLFGDLLKRAHLVSISPATSAALRGLGFEPDAEATNYDMQGLIEAMNNHQRAIENP